MEQSSGRNKKRNKKEVPVMKVSEKLLKLSSGKFLLVIDNLFTMAEQRAFKGFVEKSYYRLGSTSADFTEVSKKYETFFRSIFSEDDVENFGLIKIVSNFYPKYFADRKNIVSWVNVTFPGNTYSYHCDWDIVIDKKPDKLEDADAISLLYYCNIKWDYDDGGETIFCDDDGDPEIAIGCKPNRIVLFDATIPHRPSLTKHTTNGPRYTFTAGFPKKWIQC